MVLTKESVRESTVLVRGNRERIKSKISSENISHVLTRLTNLYTRPEYATVREIISNAFDASAHLPADERKPPQVTTPTQFDAHFVVEDFGCGMSLETAKKVYVDYGATTKKQDLNSIGVYGLGGKAPLAYASYFTVETTHGGFTTRFRMFKSNGEVETEILSHEETGRPSGTKVSVPVQESDFDNFRRAIENYRSYSWENPIVIDGTLFDGHSDYVALGDVLIHRDSKTGEELFGTLRFRREALGEYFNRLHYLSEGTEDLVYYELGGWPYSAVGESTTTKLSPMVISIRPGLVNFDSSRDSITMDDAAKELNKLVTEELLSERIFLKLFAIFRSFSQQELRAFTREVKESFFRKSSENDELILQTIDGKVLYSGNFSELDTDLGINPYYLQRKELPSSIRLALVRVFRYSTQRIYYAETHRRQSLLSEGLSQTELRHLAYVKERYPTHTSGSLSAFATAIYNAEHKSIQLITGVDEKIMSSLLRKREHLFNYHSDDTYLLLTDLTLEQMSSEDLNYAKRLLGDERLFIDSFEEYDEKLKPYLKSVATITRKRNAEIRDSSLDEPIRVQRLIVAKTPQETLKATTVASSYCFESAHYSYSELKELDAHIFICWSGLWKGIYRGAINAAYEFKPGSTIVILDSEHNAVQWNALAKMQDKIFTSAHLHSYVHTKTARELVSKRSFDALVLDSDLRASALADLLGPLVSSNIHFASLRAMLEHVPSHERELRKICKSYLMLEDNDNRLNYELHETFKKELLRRGQKSKIETIDRLHKAYEQLVSGNNQLENKLYATLLREFNPKDNSELVESAMRSMAQRLYHLYVSQEQA